MKPSPIKKAVFPVAGMGTRFLPATKANPKEMLPIVDKPLIQYAVEEAIAAGITELIFITSSSKRAIEDHFDSNYELEAKLEQAGRSDLLDIVRNILPPGVSCAYVRQVHPLGLGHAVLCAKSLIGNESFAVLLADDLMEDGAEGCLKEMLAQRQSKSYPTNIVAVEHIPRQESKKYGIVALESEDAPLNRIHGIIEKPAPEEAPSNLAVVGRYILTSRIFDMLEQTAIDSRGEIQLTDAIARLLPEEAVYAYQLQGKRYDCGSKLGYLQATVHHALRHPEVGKRFQEYLQGIFEHEVTT
jgi:UTP--glucose-1-phosphate uridylyltransferase